MNWILFLWAPLALGALWGAWQGRRERFSFVVLLTAPIFSAVLITGAMLAVAIVSGSLRVNPNNPEPLVLQWLSGVLGIIFLYGFGIFLFGAVPALVGSAAGQLTKRCMVHHDSGIRQNGTNNNQNHQDEPEASADRPRE
jgi:hypothetical protein